MKSSTLILSQRLTLQQNISEKISQSIWLLCLSTNSMFQANEGLPLSQFQSMYLSCLWARVGVNADPLHIWFHDNRCPYFSKSCSNSLLSMLLARFSERSFQSHRWANSSISPMLQGSLGFFEIPSQLRTSAFFRKKSTPKGISLCHEI